MQRMQFRCARPLSFGVGVELLELDDGAVGMERRVQAAVHCATNDDELIVEIDGPRLRCDVTHLRPSASAPFVQSSQEREASEYRLRISPEMAPRSCSASAQPVTFLGSINWTQRSQSGSLWMMGLAARYARILRTCWDLPLPGLAPLSKNCSRITATSFIDGNRGHHGCAEASVSSTTPDEVAFEIMAGPISSTNELSQSTSEILSDNKAPMQN